MHKEIFNANNQIKQLNQEIKKADKEMDNISKRVFSEEEKRHLENEANFILYLVKTKQAKYSGKDLLVGKSEPYTKYNDLDAEDRKYYFEKYEDEQLLVLEFILYGQLLSECIDQMNANYYGNMTAIKTALQVVKKKLTPVINKDFKTVYKNGSKAEKGNESGALLNDLEYQAKEMASFRVPAKVVMSKMAKAFNYDNDTMLATSDRLIKKFEK